MGEASYSAIIRGTTDDDGRLRIPVLDERVRMILRIDVQDLLEEEVNASPDGASSGGQPPPAGTAGTPPATKPSDPGYDTDRYPDEDYFLPLVLD